MENCRGEQNGSRGGESVVHGWSSASTTTNQHTIYDTCYTDRGEFPNTTVGFVHIDDVVAAHILAMVESKASGRLICSSSVAHWSEINEMLRAKYPSYPYENNFSWFSMETSKTAQLVFPPFKTLETMFDDCITSFQQKRFLISMNESHKALPLSAFQVSL
ncbi:tetraketide alpha-pyrone reductase 2-like [Pyrus ussuriensis x Pyrus communis]|uniref:Tetraketide alpha-pyrone reductase 2-like n=1 Tax=Pyrus ussuriensis x Pyrus communis TaxID=2448454 RepID=A0A5N5HDR7_9ROSA|nr:tetraketide alpha-pyrone reductase 2-like [Pyrus ussuriensis x Pyrus communis]